MTQERCGYMGCPHPAEPGKRFCKESQPKDPINSPSHYLRDGIEVIAVCEAFELDLYTASAVQYILRSKYKAAELEDLQKARWYIDRKISRLQKVTLGSQEETPRPSSAREEKAQAARERAKASWRDWSQADAAQETETPFCQADRPHPLSREYTDHLYRSAAKWFAKSWQEEKQSRYHAEEYRDVAFSELAQAEEAEEDLAKAKARRSPP